MSAPTIPDIEIDRLAALYELRISDTPPEERFDWITQLTSTIVDHVQIERKAACRS